MPLGEWTRRLGALRAEAYDWFMVGHTSVVRARLLVANNRLPSDHRMVNHPIMGQPAANIVSGRQLRAARVLGGIIDDFFNSIGQ
jgi:hypothetical protein